MAPGGNRGWLLRLVIAFGCAQGAVSMARPAVSYRALALGADERAVGVIAGVYALLPLFAAVPLGRRTDHGRCAPLLPAGVVLIAGGCVLSGLAGSLWAMALWSGVMGLGHLCFVIGAQSLVARRSAPHEQDRDFGHFTIGGGPGPASGRTRSLRSAGGLRCAPATHPHRSDPTSPAVGPWVRHAPARPTHGPTARTETKRRRTDGPSGK